MKIHVWQILLFAWQLCLVVSSISHREFSAFDSPSFCSLIITPACNTTFSYIDQLNEQIRPHLVELIKTPYFKYFKLDFDKQCKFWDAQHFCATENCAVEILPPSQYNWSDVANEDLKPSKLGEINRAFETESPEAAEAETCEDIDYCHIDDDHHCDYVNLLDNPERFTGYGGSQSFDVWKAIYSENCFPNTNPMSMKEANAEPEQRIEKNLFYRLISGMHASIAVHLSNEYLCPNTGEFRPNLKVFMERVGNFNERVSNVYFNYALVTQSIVKLQELIPLIETISDVNDDQLKKQSFFSKPSPNYKKLVNSIIPDLSANLLFNTSSLFNPETVEPTLKDEFRARFKNVSAIMDCVGCDRCRMWGKLQTIGYGTALKILFESDNFENIKFRRIELVALFNTFDRLSKSVEAINNFKQMYLDNLQDVKTGNATPEDYDKIECGPGLDFPFRRQVSSIIADSSSSVISASLKEQPTKNMNEKPNTSNFDLMKDDFYREFNEVWNVFIFVIKSYRDFPLYVYKYCLMMFNKWWNLLIGRQNLENYNEFAVNIGESAYIKS